MKKSIITFVLIISLFFVNVSRSEAGYEVTAMNASKAFFSVGVAYVPALVKGSNGAVTALKTGTLAIPAVRGGSIAAAIAFAALTYGADKLFDYLTKQGFPIDPNTHLPLKPVTTYDLPAGFMNPIPGDTMYVVGYYDTYNQAYYAINAKVVQFGLNGPTIGHQYPAGRTIDYVFAYSNYSQIWVAFYGSQSQSHTDMVPATESDISSSVATGLSSGNQDAKDALIDVLNRVNDSMKNLNDTLNKKTDTITKVKKDLNDSISDSTKTKVDDKLADPNATDDYADDAMTEEAEKTKIEDSIEKSLGTASATPVDPTIENPEKKNLTNVLTTFMNQINSLPLLNTLNGITVSCSGTSVLCLNMPSNYGGSRCWDAVPIRGDLNNIGTALLSITSILSFIMIFKS